MSNNIPPKLEDIAREQNVDNLLNNKDFAEFLAEHPDPDSIDLDDTAEVQKYWQTFEAKEHLKERLQEIYNQEVGEKLGLELEGSDFSSLDSHLDELALEDPEALLELQRKIYTFEALPAEIKQMEAELAQMGGTSGLIEKLTALKKDRQALEVTADYQKIFDPSRFSFGRLRAMLNLSSIRNIDLTETNQAINDLQDRYGQRFDYESVSAQVAEQIASIEKNLSEINEAAALRDTAAESFSRVRSELLDSVADAAEIAKAIQTRIEKEFTDVLANGGIDALNEAEERLETWAKGTANGDFDIDPLKNIDAAEIQKKLDERLEVLVSKEISGAISKNSFGRNPLTKMEKTLEPFLKMEQIGSKDQAEIREFIIDQIKEAAAKLGTSTEDKAKKLLLRRILVKATK